MNSAFRRIFTDGISITRYSSCEHRWIQVDAGEEKSNLIPDWQQTFPCPGQLTTDNKDARKVSVLCKN